MSRHLKCLASPISNRQGCCTSSQNSGTPSPGYQVGILPRRWNCDYGRVADVALALSEAEYLIEQGPGQQYQGRPSKRAVSSSPENHIHVAICTTLVSATRPSCRSELRGV